MTNPDRHLSADSFEEFVRQAVPIEHPIPGDPRLTLFIDPKRQEIGLRMQAAPDTTASETRLEHVRLRSVQRKAGRSLEVVVTDPRLFAEAYPVLCAVADRVQLQGLTLGIALDDTLRILGRLLERVETLSVEKELGLFGEILLFLGLSRQLGPAEALEAWRGPGREEHDFGVEGYDIEVKTTAAERRSHWIGSLTQLLPNRDRTLWLVSHQLTRAEASDGSTLPALVEIARHRVGDLRPVLNRKLHAAGWHDHYADTCRTRWRRRTRSMAFAVVDDFPCLTPPKLQGVSLTRIPDVRYRIDLTDQPVGEVVPDFLVEALKHGVTE
ncbi:hypothetical protein GCM10010466_07230 [Planomonospora alba]|uniref:PD-(D/E)XK motif protein n=1 Tax=Planomonospora alba TaxID=161354 RepID=A0ABP6MMP8_9ACTN